MEKRCKYCLEIINYDKHQQFAYHVSRCTSNPNFEFNKTRFNNGKFTVKRLDITLNCKGNYIQLRTRIRNFLKINIL